MKKIERYDVLEEEMEAGGGRLKIDPAMLRIWTGGNECACCGRLLLERSDMWIVGEFNLCPPCMKRISVNLVSTELGNS